MKIICRTNLDLDYEEWPTELPALPRKGDWIQSGVDHNGFRLQLEVTSVTWKQVTIPAQNGFTRSPERKEWQAFIELNDPKIFNRSIKEFYEWYAPKIGKSVGSFI